MKRLIVARWQEDVAWSDQVHGWKPLIVQKDVDLPNTGREASSWFWAMRKLRPRTKPDDLLAFLQGKPTDHCELASVYWKTTGFRWLGDATYEAEFDGRPHHFGLPMRERYEEWLGRPWPGKVRFAPGGQFVITGRELLAFPTGFYTRMQHAVCPGEGAWVMERLWGEMFGGVASDRL